MGEYIEREAAIAALIEFRDDQTVSKYATVMQCKAARDAISRATKVLESLPAADVEPVVRCKDCKYWQDNNDGYPHEECRWGHGETPDANDFCSYGEQKEGDD